MSAPGVAGAPVDVLTVMRKVHNMVGTHPRGNPEVERESYEAMRAVAELIERERLLREAAHAFRQWINSGDAALYRKAEAMNREAIARVGGAG